MDALLVADQHVNEALLRPKSFAVHLRGFSSQGINNYGAQSSFFQGEKRIFLASDILSNVDDNLQALLRRAQQNVKCVTRLSGRDQQVRLEREWLVVNRHRY